ncbi:hypothetical protein ACFFLM_10165 [Deinococcus oregonensis]|uniref:Uncharacterized protein n=1 Tax=Deinococcus oregonensis TaxID=1805970 RepID=A0ABV6AXU5_9DEIO
MLALPSYSAVADTRGTLTVTVVCDRPNERAILRLDAPLARPVSGGDLLMPLTNARNQTVMVRLMGGSLWQRGTPLQGSGVVSLPVLAEANQWNGLGYFSATITLSLQPTASGSTALNPASFASDPLNFANPLPAGSQNESLP